MAVTETKTYKVKRGDYGYLIPWTLLNADDSAFNLDGYTVHLKVWLPNKPSQLFVNGECDPVSEPAGTLTYTVAEGDFLEAGTFNAEYEATKTGEAQSFNTFQIVVEESP